MWLRSGGSAQGLTRLTPRCHLSCALIRRGTLAKLPDSSQSSLIHMQSVVRVTPARWHTPQRDFRQETIGLLFFSNQGAEDTAFAVLHRQRQFWGYLCWVCFLNYFFVCFLEARCICLGLGEICISEPAGWLPVRRNWGCCKFEETPLTHPPGHLFP